MSTERGSNVNKIDNTFNRIMGDINKFEQVFKQGGSLEQAVMQVEGDPSHLKDVAQALSNLYEALEDAHFGTTGHITGESVKESKRTIKEGVLDGDDDDGFMARSQLYFLARDAITLHGAIDDRDDLEPWVQSKIAQASKDIDAVRRYTEYNAVEAENSMPHSHDEEIPMQMEPELEESHGYLSDCCGAPADSEMDDNMQAMCGNCKDYSSFSPMEETTINEIDHARDYVKAHAPERMIGMDPIAANAFLADLEKTYPGMRKELGEGTWAMPETPEDVEALTALMQEPILVGEDGDNASNVMYNILGDDELFDEFVDMAHTMGPDTDARPAIEARLKALGLMEGMNFNEKRTDDLQVVAKDLFKNALANAKKKSKATKVSEGNAPEPRKMQVTTADRDAKTPAWKRFKAGDPAYEYKKLKPKTISGDN